MNRAETPIPQALATACHRGRLIPFVGSGLSLSVGDGLFPTWKQLLDKLADRLQAEGQPNPAAIVRLHCEEGELFEAAEKALAKLGLQRFHEVMRDTFPLRPPTAPAPVLDLPQAIWDLQPPIVVTTNYDSILQWARPNTRRVLNHQHAELADLFAEATATDPIVWHLHGHVDEADSLILGPTQYARLYEQRGDCLQAYAAALLQLKQALVNHTFVFIGFGMNDDYVVDQLGEVFALFRKTNRPHFAVLPKGEADAAALWKDGNVQLIEVAGHGQPLVDCVRQIAVAAEKAADDSADHGSDQPAATVPPGYFPWLKRQCGGVELLGLQDQQGRAVELYQVYVPLTTPVATEGMKSGAGEFDPDGAPLTGRAGRETERQLDLLLGRVAEKSLFLSGAAGTGKSTFCRWLAYLIAAGEMPEVTPPPPEEFQEQFPESQRDTLPLLVPLRDFWSALPPGNGRRELSAAQFHKTLDGWLDEKQPGGLAAACVAAHREAGRLLLMLDGFDEVPISSGSGSAACYPRAMLLSALTEAVPDWTAAGNRVLVTSRPYGLSQSEAGDLGLETARIAELDDHLRQLLVRRWFGVLSPEQEEDGSPADEMLAHIAQRGELAPLVANPMLLTAMCVIFNQGKRLPRDTHELYHRILDNVLYNRYRDTRHELPLIRQRLSVIAYGMHTGAGLDEERQTPQAEATYTELEQMIQRYQDTSPAKEAGFRGAVDTREDLLSRSGILLPMPQDRAGFYHFTIQDFLAAQLILEREADLAAFFRQRAIHEQWRGTLSFVFSSLMARNTLPDKGIRLLEQLIEQLDLDALPLALVVADCLEILSGLSVNLRDDHVQNFRELCQAAISREVELGPRVELAHALGRLGDPRVVDDLRNHDDSQAWYEISAGEYPVGGGRAFHDIEPLKRERFHVDEPFRITRYPVTNSQFGVFLEEGGYSGRDWWSDAGWQWRQENAIVEPSYWRDVKWNGANQPVVGVSFWEAEAFGRWAGGRLPGEREWEAATRGPKRSEYPWGDEWPEGICNTRELQLGRTSPVGTFPASRAKPFGLDDAAGNVWEWCEDEAKTKGYGVCRVVRGGSWCDLGAVYARCGFRGRRQPDFCYYNLGFRLCVCISPGLASR